MAKRITHVEYGDPTTAHLFDHSSDRENKTIKMSTDDIKSKTVVYCKDGYAQDLFDVYVNRMSNEIISKDASVGGNVSVRAVSFNKVSKMIKCEIVGNGAMVLIPSSEFIYDINEITSDFVFDALITKAESGSYQATCKNPAKYKAEIEAARVENKWFNVKIISLIRGGYRATYKDTIECFIPGSHAAANIIENFEDLIGKTLPVMVDNFDWSSKMYVVSYKKYVKLSLPEMIHDIKFNHKYTGKLTSNPTEYGLFVEFENYFTGLIHKLDFENYDEVCKNYKTGDVVDVYVKNITEKKGNYRIILALNEAEVDKLKSTWYRFKTTCENQTLSYGHNTETNNLIVALDETENITIALPREFNTSALAKYKKIKVYDVNVLRQEIKFDFCN